MDGARWRFRRVLIWSLIAMALLLIAVGSAVWIQERRMRCQMNTVNPDKVIVKSDWGNVDSGLSCRLMAERAMVAGGDVVIPLQLELRNQSPSALYFVLGGIAPHPPLYGLQVKQGDGQICGDVPGRSGCAWEPTPCIHPGNNLLMGIVLVLPSQTCEEFRKEKALIRFHFPRKPPMGLAPGGWHGEIFSEWLSFEDILK